MKRVIVLLVFLFAFTQTTFAQLSDLSGIWRTQYIGEDADLDRETYVFKQTPSGITGICTSFYYFDITDIKLEGKKLSFTVTNTLDKDDIYILKFEMELLPNAEQTTFVGKFTNQNGIDAHLEMVLVEEFAK